MQSITEIAKAVVEKLTSKEAGVVAVVAVGAVGVYMIVREGLKIIAKA